MSKRRSTPSWKLKELASRIVIDLIERHGGHYKTDARRRVGLTDGDLEAMDKEFARYIAFATTRCPHLEGKPATAFKESLEDASFETWKERAKKWN